MSVDQLSTEILQNILERLCGDEVIKCRAVSRRWRAVVDSLSNQHWRRICGNDRRRSADYIQVQAKYGLPWREVFSSLNSWHCIDKAVLNINKVCDDVQGFKVLPKGILALLKKRRHQYLGYSDTIVYYNIETSRECGRKEFNFTFYTEKYDENEQVLVIVKEDDTLCIVSKVAGSQHCVGKVNIYTNVYNLAFTIIGNEVYFHNIQDEFIYLSELRESNGKVTVNTNPIGYFTSAGLDKTAVYFSKCNGKLFVLDRDRTIYCHNDLKNRFEIIGLVKFTDLGFEILLNDYNIDWRNPDVFQILRDENDVYEAYYAHGNTILAVYRCSTKVKLFLRNNYVNNRFIKAMSICIDNTTLDTRINQLDIVENGLNHKILILVDDLLYVYDYNASRRRSHPMLLRDRTYKRVRIT